MSQLFYKLSAAAVEHSRRIDERSHPGVSGEAIPLLPINVGDRGLVRGLIAKGVRTPPERLKKRRAGAARLPNQACKPLHALPLHAARLTNGVRDGRLGVRPRWTGVLANARLSGGRAGLARPPRQACTAGTPVRPGSRKPLESRGLREPLVPL
ncbi:hypothetical protein PCANC_15267 [Puccinia coronata f. sp. avenae]|uniref:Uncharacterized protein n=1 Tax=Puccinia coronata f. sp. avenae TaxID=200324 RepID=A0A2N5UIP6_9BASI|nr:hypothetical protein PCANC_15267 [Puccinia coronata f. sp. avenae]